MGKFLRWTAVIAAILGGVYWWYAMEGGLPASAHYDFDIAKVRQLADSLPGDKPNEIRYENNASIRFPEAMIVAGDPWAWSAMPVYSYQLVYAGHTALIDTGLDRAGAPPKFMLPFFDDAAYLHVQQAMEKASLIVITHEHMDHIGGLAHHPNLKAVLPSTRLTDLQVAHQERMKPDRFPDDVMKGYQPLHYDHYDAIAPGVVLIAAPGHTPGSQMVYVKRADGKELLFLGDVAWHMRNIEIQRERPRWVTDFLISENRFQVAGELKALHALAQAAPDVHLVPGHDGQVIDALTRGGLLQPGFVR